MSTCRAAVRNEAIPGARSPGRLTRQDFSRSTAANPPIPFKKSKSGERRLSAERHYCQRSHALFSYR
jgi:hypothetical protein